MHTAHLIAVLSATRGELRADNTAPMAPKCQLRAFMDIYKEGWTGRVEMPTGEKDIDGEEVTEWHHAQILCGPFYGETPAAARVEALTGRACKYGRDAREREGTPCEKECSCPTHKEVARERMKVWDDQLKYVALSDPPPQAEWEYFNPLREEIAEREAHKEEIYSGKNAIDLATFDF